ncbi:hypothetical protein [Microbacterium sp.]|uniref:hypothetical protein n=1 Tax=Microbacterium sp. TaxID=51671 RepID=UPI002638E006|nr:hypothetical protein [Microbacterium sp.]
MSDPLADDPTETGLDKGPGDPNDDRAYLDDLPLAQVQDEPADDGGVDTDEADDGT